jgi:hypothetical protein
MTNLSALSKRLSLRELEVRRLYARDEDFRNACDDYVVAVTALQRWESDESTSMRAAEYRELAEEIAGEIVARLVTTWVAQDTRLQTGGSHMIKQQKEQQR